MGYDQSTNLFLAQEVEPADEELFENLPQDTVFYFVSGARSTGQFEHHWVRATQSSIELSEGRYGTGDAVNITDLTWAKSNEIKQWLHHIEDFVKEYNLKPIGIPGWIAAATGY